VESKDSQATRLRDLIIEHFDLSNRSPGRPYANYRRGLVQRAFAFAGDRIVSDRELPNICSEILEKLCETCQQKSECVVWHGMWMDDFCRLKQFIIEHIDFPASLMRSNWQEAKSTLKEGGYARSLKFPYWF
jgi:hypothetical protein